MLLYHQCLHLYPFHHCHRHLCPIHTPPPHHSRSKSPTHHQTARLSITAGASWCLRFQNPPACSQTLWAVWPRPNEAMASHTVGGCQGSHTGSLPAAAQAGAMMPEDQQDEVTRGRGGWGVIWATGA
jgi:hypothetical protein